MMGRPTLAIHIGQVFGIPAILTMALAVFQPGCPHNPNPSPSGPGGTGGAIVTGTGGTQDPGPVPPGDPVKCAVAEQHAEGACRGAGQAIHEACPKVGGANPALVDCWTTAPSCDALTACGRPADTGRGPIHPGR
jgi:hypothetical protein